MEREIPNTKHQINSNQKYLKFPLPPHPLPQGEREKVRGVKC